MKNKLNIGLDIGTTSVGWSLMDENNNIIDLGVRLFPDPANPKDGKLGNEKRREMRTSRRRNRRVRHRKDRLIKLFIKYGFIKTEEELEKILESPISNYSDCKNPIEIKVKGLNNKLNNEELLITLFHYMHHRGYSYLSPEEVENKNQNRNINLYPSQQLLEFYNFNGYYRSSRLNQEFSKWDYEKEIKQLLLNQKINDNFIKEYLELFIINRDFSQGPGSEKSPTQYGLYRRNKNGQIEKIGHNLWEETIGKCTYYEDQLRGGKYSPIAEVFNLLNDINNLRINSRLENIYISNKEKEEIFNLIKEQWLKGKNKNISIKDISKICSRNSDTISVDDISGYSDIQGKLSTLENYSTIIKLFLENNVIQNEFEILDIKILMLANSFYEILRKNPSDVLKQKQSIEESNFKIDEESLENILKNKIKSLSSTHSLSYKAMLEYINEAKEHPINQRVFFSEHLNAKIGKVDKSKYIKSKMLNEMIISPTTRRALRQSINVLNRIFKLYSKKYDIGNITIEMPRDKNSAEETKSLQKLKKLRDEFVTKCDKEFNIDISKLNAKQRLKLSLWLEQDRKDIYTGQSISFENVINKNSEFDVDHIIPYSISFDDSKSNKVLTLKTNNNDKLNQTPWQWLSKNGKYDNFELHVNDLYDRKLINKKKRDFLLYKNDPINDLQGFMAKNLVDTRYASSEILHYLQNFQKVNSDLYPHLKIKVITGAITNFARNNLIKIKKEREWYHHHAVDATIVNFLGNNNKINKLTTWTYQVNKKIRNESTDKLLKIVDYDTGEILTLSDNFQKDINENNIVTNLKAQLNKLVDENKVKFSRQLVTRKNVALSNETIYSVIWNSDKKKCYKISKINLLESKNHDLSKIFSNDAKEEDKEKLLIYKYDRNMFNKLQSIYANFIKLDKNVNVFKNYMKTEFNIENPKNICIGKQNINKIRFVGDEKDINSVIVLKDHNNNAILESLNMISIRIYKNNANKYIAIPINQKVLSFKNNHLYVDEEKLTNVLKLKDIENDKYIEINNGTVFISKNDNKLFYSNGGGNLNNNCLEIKSLFCDNQIRFNRKQMQISLSTIIADYDICDVDELGNVYNRRNIMI